MAREYVISNAVRIELQHCNGRKSIYNNNSQKKMGLVVNENIYILIQGHVDGHPGGLIKRIRVATHDIAGDRVRITENRYENETVINYEDESLNTAPEHGLPGDVLDLDGNPVTE